VLLALRNGEEEKMACTVKRPVKLEVSLETKNQTREKVHEIVDALLRENGVIECGIMGAFSMTLREASPDPAPELKKQGVTSVKTIEAH
jgi:hypothetical protein